MMGAFPDKFLFGQGVSNRLPTQQNWKHFSLYYDGQFDDPLFIVHSCNQLQRACCIRNSARITGKNLATLRSLGVLATQRNSKDNLFGQEIILTPKRQSHLIQRFLKFFRWWGLPFHTVLLNVLLPDQNWMLCNIVTALARILLQEHLLSLKIC